MSCSVCPRRRGSRVEHSGRQAGRQRARSPRVARGVRPGARPARPGRGGTRRRAGRHRAVAPARAAGREAGRSAGHDRGSGGSGRAGHGRSREPAGGGGAARRGTRCGRAVGRGRWVAHCPTRPRRAGARRRDHRGARGAAREFPARGAHTRDRPHGAGRPRRPAGVTALPSGASATPTPPATQAVQALLDVYARVGPLLVGGEGAELIAEDGTRYLDFVAGIGVNALGYNHPVIRAAIERALGSGLIHVSNLYRSEAGERLAEELVARSFADRAFFCNSGAEANEAAFKFARKWSGKSEIVAFSGSFHGRLFATLAATDRPDYRKPFEPLVPGIRIVPREDWAAVDHAVSASRTAAGIVEPVQGEGGVRLVEAEWLGFLRELCDSRGVAVIFDEVQCGLGRTGTLFAYEQAGVVPDILTLAKPLAGGLPMGAVLVTSAVAAALKPGDPATTFGGGPLVASVARDVVRTIP